MKRSTGANSFELSESDIAFAKAVVDAHTRALDGWKRHVYFEPRGTIKMTPPAV